MTLGRQNEASITIDDPRASRSHAMIRKQPDGFWFVDLGSSNGSYINDRRVTKTKILQNGDLVKIGDCEFRFEGGLVTLKDIEAARPAQTMVGTQSKDALILVSDIQGFTSLSENLSSAELSQIMGSWYAEVRKTVEKEGATVDKFIGDCVLAYWLNTAPPVRQAALKTAEAIQNAAEEVHRQHDETLSKAGIKFRTGAAIHLGSVAYGAVSAGEFTLLGDAVNLTFRLESLTRELKKAVLVSGEFLDSWGAGRALCEPCGSHQVKGRHEPVEVFSLEGDPESI